MKNPSTRLSEIRSRRRVVDHGEVFTDYREVIAMCDLIEAIPRLQTRVLEPACGSGNFLVEVLRRKLDLLVANPPSSVVAVQRHLVGAVSCLYGIDLLRDNVSQCRLRLLRLCILVYEQHVRRPMPEELRITLRYIINSNVVRGDCLSFSSLGVRRRALQFSEWVFVSANRVKRIIYEYRIEGSPVGGDSRVVSSKPNAMFNIRAVKTDVARHYLKLNADV